MKEKFKDIAFGIMGAFYFSFSIMPLVVCIILLNMYEPIGLFWVVPSVGCTCVGMGMYLDSLKDISKM